MINLNQGLFGVVVTASILTIAPSALAFSVVFGDRDTARADFIDSLNTNTLSTVIDDGTETNFGEAPAVGSVSSVTRSGTINSKNFTYTIYLFGRKTLGFTDGVRFVSTKSSYEEGCRAFLRVTSGVKFALFNPLKNDNLQFIKVR